MTLTQDTKYKGTIKADAEFAVGNKVRNHMTTPSVIIHDNDLTTSFVNVLDLIQGAVHTNSVEKGFWEASTDAGTKIALMHSELSEALEAIRKPHIEGKLAEINIDLLTEELADCVIRIMDFCEREKLPLGKAIIGKARYNTGRSKLHGGKAF